MALGPRTAHRARRTGEQSCDGARLQSQKSAADAVLGATRPIRRSLSRRAAINRLRGGRVAGSARSGAVIRLAGVAQVFRPATSYLRAVGARTEESRRA